jgi:hypothetical protein
MSLTVYETGDTKKVSFTFKDKNGTLIDPPTVKFVYWRWEDESVRFALTYPGAGTPIVRDSQGNYHVALLLDRAGVWHIEAHGLGVVAADGKVYNAIQFQDDFEVIRSGYA